MVILPIDEHMGFTDALVRCTGCGAVYLLELLDQVGHYRALRISRVRQQHADALTHSLSRGSCDLNRAGDEIHHLRTSTQLAPWLLLVDWRQPVLQAVVEAPPDRALPTISWRELPGDGWWVRYALSKTDIVKP